MTEHTKNGITYSLNDRVILLYDQDEVDDGLPIADAVYAERRFKTAEAALKAFKKLVKIAMAIKERP